MPVLVYDALGEFSNGGIYGTITRVATNKVATAMSGIIPWRGQSQERTYDMQEHTTQESTNEIWKDIPGYEGLYQVSSFGRVRSLDKLVAFKRWPNGRMIKGRILIQGTDMAGYKTFRPVKNGIPYGFHIHNAVMQAFVGPRPHKHDIHHINEIKTDNRLENLCYLSESDHAKTIRPNPPKGEKSPHAKVTEADVRMMRKLYEAGTHAKRQLARMYGLSQKTARYILERKSWKHIE